ncbi:cyclic nucleotide-binding domain containing protein [Stylonychia lemnae]|uniref:Cyclic nucleotide-binding domain containing protein n=1 Tax=Stylonychia lemnae TaxID=5949 RepID=A0A078BBF8_STYLE|nr:cyclic nucleotide-binding domain containing protein [Stylonychia lemnae]|eukprot:CDW91734.1 cyclic nucleotide-binding domain containing protein [Stylonychia lemnae]
MSDNTDDRPKLEQVKSTEIPTSPRQITQKPSSFQMLQSNTTFEKLLNKDIQEKPTFEEIIVILQKKSDWRNREEIKKLIYFFQGLSFFESLKKESEVDEDIIYQCCRELKCRKYATDQKIIQYGEDGNEFYIIIKGEVDILTPKTVEVQLSQSELHEYIDLNQELIIWDRHNKHLLEQYHDQNRASNSSSNLLKSQMSSVGGTMRGMMKRSFQTLMLSQDREIQAPYEFQFLTTSLTLNSGLGFGELALMNSSSKKPEKRAATVISKTESYLAVLERDDFTKVFLYSMQKKLDAKVEFFKNFRISEGISRTNLNKLSYYLKEKQFRRRDIVFKEGDVADVVYFIKEGEFETKLDKVTVQKGQTTLLKNIEVKVSIIGPNQIIGLDDLNKEKTTYRQNKVQLNESQRIKEPFFSQRLNILQNQANRENMKWLQQKERYMSRETLSQDTLKECKNVVDSVQNEELCNLLLRHKLLKRPQIKIERVTSTQVMEEEELLNDYDPNRYSNKEYFLKMSKLYNQFVFNTNQFQSNNGKQKPQTRHQSPSPTNKILSQDDQQQFILQHASSTIDLESKKNNVQISPKVLKTSASQKHGTIYYNQSTTFSSIKENQLKMTQNNKAGNQLIKNPSFRSLNSPQALGFNKLQSEFDKQGGEDGRFPEFKISLKKNLSNVNLMNPINEQINAQPTLPDQQKPQQNTQRTNNNKIMGNIIIEESLMSNSNQIQGLTSVNNQPPQTGIATINNLAKQRTRKQEVLKQIVTDSTNQNQPNGTYTISMNQSQIDNYPNIENQTHQSINLNDSQQQKQLRTLDVQKIGRVTSGEKSKLLMHNSSSPQFNINKMSQGKEDQVPLSSDSKRLNRRQKSQIQIRTVKAMKGKKNSLTIEDIQAHLQQSQNSLLKLLEKRLKEKHDMQMTDNNLLHQQLHFMNTQGKLQDIESNKFQTSRQKVLSSQYNIHSNNGNGMPNPSYFGQPFSPNAKSTYSNDMNPSQKSNIYFNMYITKKRL